MRNLVSILSGTSPFAMEVKNWARIVLLFANCDFFFLPLFVLHASLIKRSNESTHRPPALSLSSPLRPCMTIFGDMCTFSAELWSSSYMLGAIVGKVEAGRVQFVNRANIAIFSLSDFGYC